ncbi:hypothetical protein BJ944DRAFT_242900 [Cunninghamella echinulata]|nr:hypothetical protein BJ944DRAFT_242900 [Cunninghamella echinulata]
MGSKPRRVIKNITNDSNIFKETKEYNIDENVDDEFDFVSDNYANKVTSIIEKVIEGNDNQGYTNVLFDEHASKALIKDITEDDLDKLFQTSRVDVCTVNAFLNDIQNTNETIIKNLIKIKNLPGNSNEYYINGNIRRFYMCELFLNILTKTLINRPRGEPYIECQQINEKTLALIYTVIQFRLNLLSKNQAKKDIQLTYSGDWFSGYKKILTKDIDWEEAINNIKEQCADIIASDDSDEYYI